LDHVDISASKKGLLQLPQSRRPWFLPPEADVEGIWFVDKGGKRRSDSFVYFQEKAYTLIHAVTERELQELKALGTNLGRPRSLLFAQRSAITEIVSKRYGTCPRHLGFFPIIYDMVKPGFTHIG
jgi:hypothetical protein